MPTYNVRFILRSNVSVSADSEGEAYDIASAIYSEEVIGRTKCVRMVLSDPYDNDIEEIEDEASPEQKEGTLEEILASLKAERKC